MEKETHVPGLSSMQTRMDKDKDSLAEFPLQSETDFEMK
jgi:hypothetical protein